MNLVRHVVIALLLDAGAVLAFGGNDEAMQTDGALPLCASPVYPAAASTSLSTPMEPAHENK